MQTNKILRWILLLAATLIVIAAVGVSTVVFFKSRRQVATFVQAGEAFRSGDYALAKNKLKAVLRKDYSHEGAWVMLAGIFETQNLWRPAASCWNRIVSLNRLEEKYTVRRINALYRSMDYKELIAAVQALPEAGREPFLGMYAVALVRSGQGADAARVLARLDRQSEAARLVGLLLKSPTPSYADLKPFFAAADPVVAEEALLCAYDGAFGEQKFAVAEELLKQAAERNPEVATYLLGDFYFSRGEMKAASEAYSRANNYYMPESSAVHWAEALFLQTQLADLKKLDGKFVRGGKTTMLYSAYVRAMTAYLENDFDTLGKHLELFDGSINTQIAAMMKFGYGLKTGNIKDVTEAVAAFKAIPGRPFDAKGILDRVRPMLEFYYQRGRFAEAAGLAGLLSSIKPPDILLTRLELLGKASTGELTPAAVRRELAVFPNDPVLNRLAIVAALGKNDNKAGLALIEKQIAGGDGGAEVQALQLEALERLGKIPEALTLYDRMRKERPDDPQLTRRYLAFCCRNGLEKQLRSFKGDPDLELIAAMELAVLHKDSAALSSILKNPKLWEGLNADGEPDRELMYTVAMRLAEADEFEPAIALYNKLKPVMRDPLLIELNLAELYAAAGRREEALAEAKSAWMRQSTLAVTRSCYAIRLCESGQWQEALPLLEMEFNDPRIQPYLIKALEHCIVDSFARGSAAECGRLLNKLSRIAPDNPVAREYRAKLTAKNQSK
ncbi:MAG: tetratricopeptide repeat protein [Victivallaceae bacterium]